MADPLTIRQNNPGALEYAPWMKSYGATPGQGGRYAQFSSPDQGYNAMGKVLDTYQNKYGLNTVRGIVNRWAPPNVDNNSTDSYVAHVARGVGVGPDDPLKPEHRGPLMQHMASYEAGRTPAPLPGQSQPSHTPAPQTTGRPMALGFAAPPSGTLPSDQQIQLWGKQADRAYQNGHAALQYKGPMTWVNGLASIVNQINGSRYDQMASEGLQARTSQAQSDSQNFVKTLTGGVSQAKIAEAPTGLSQPPKAQPAPDQAPTTANATTAQTDAMPKPTGLAGVQTSNAPTGLAQPPQDQGKPAIGGLGFAAKIPSPSAAGFAAQPQQQTTAPPANAQPTIDPRIREIDQQHAAIDQQIQSLAPMLSNPQTAAQAQGMLNGLLQRKQQMEENRITALNPANALDLQIKQNQINRDSREFKQIGTDAMGYPQYGFVNNNAGTVTPANAGQGGATDAVRSAAAEGVHGENFLKTLDPMVANQIRMIASGQMAAPSNPRTPQQLGLARLLAQYDPQYDATTYNARQALRKNYMGGGKQFQELQAINTVAGHLHDLMQRANELPTVNGWGPLNWTVNHGIDAYNQASGNPAIDRFNNTAHLVADELGKAYRGGQVTEGEVQSFTNRIGSAKSPEQLRGIIGDLNTLLSSKRLAIEEAYKQGMGKAELPQDFSAVNDRVRGLFGDIDAWSRGQKSSPIAQPHQQSQAKPIPPEVRAQYDAAIQQGKPKDALIKRLQESGYDVGGLH